MFNATDDDDFFAPGTSASNLANLFGVASPQSAAATTTGAFVNSTLKYTAPKQPKEADKPKTPQNKLICVKAIHLCKLVDSVYNNVGKFGIAIIGDNSIKSYDLIIYKSKQNILSSSKLNQSFQYILDSDTDAQFTDDQKQSWQVIFGTSADFNEFLNKLKSCDAKIMPKTPAATEQPKDEIELDSSGTMARANILNRISKVGQSMLPAAALNKNVELSESEDEEVVSVVKKRKPKKQHTEIVNHPEPVVDQQQFMVPMNQYAMMQPNQMMPCYQQMMPLSDPLNVYFAENRTHNSEVRMNLTQLSNKLESVLSEIGNLRSLPTQTDCKNNDLEVNRVRGELDQYKSAVEDLRKQLDESASIIADLEIERNRAKELSELQLLEAKEASSANQKQVEELTKSNETLILKLKDFEEHHESNVSKLNEEMAKLKRTIEEQTLEASNKELKNKQNGEERIKIFTDLVKHHMNTMYQNILDRYPDNGDTKELRRCLSQNMKSATFQIIEEYKNEGDRADNDPPPVPEFEVTV